MGPVRQALKDAEPLTPPYGYQRAEDILRHYHQLPTYLENFLVFGDAVCAFNPFYGQGMNAGFEDIYMPCLLYRLN